MKKVDKGERFFECDKWTMLVDKTLHGNSGSFVGERLLFKG